MRIGLVSVVVRDYDEAIEYYTRALGFALVEDTRQSDSKRWVIVAPPGAVTGILLARAADETQIQAIGSQTGGRVFLFLYTDDFTAEHTRMRAEGVEFVEEPRDEEYGKVAVFKDLYGNKWDLIQLKKGGEF